MKKIVFALLLAMPLLTQAQTVLTPQQQLEKAKQEAQAAKEALKEAKKAAQKAIKEAKKQAKRQQSEEKPARMKAEIEHNNQDTIRYKTEAADVKNKTNHIDKVQQPNSTTEQSDWTIPDNNHETPNNKAEKVKQEGASKANNKGNLKEDIKYMAGTVPQDTEGNVVFRLDLDVQGKSAEQIYDIAYRYLEELTKGEKQIQSRVALVNKNQHIIAARYNEWLEFSNSFLSLDRTEFSYTLIAKCTDGRLELTLSRIHYNYEKERPTHLDTNAEEWITDKYALNKKKDGLRSGVAKFRRKTIDRKDEIFAGISYLLR